MGFESCPMSDEVEEGVTPIAQEGENKFESQALFNEISDFYQKINDFTERTHGFISLGGSVPEQFQNELDNLIAEGRQYGSRVREIQSKTTGFDAMTHQSVDLMNSIQKKIAPNRKSLLEDWEA